MKAVSDKKLVSSLVERQLIDCRSHHLRVNKTNNSNEEEIDDHEAIDRNTVFVVFPLVLIETFSTIELSDVALRSVTVEIRPEFSVIHGGKYAKEDYSDQDPD